MPNSDIDSWASDSHGDALEFDDYSFKSVESEPSSKLRYGALPQAKEGWVGYLSPSRVGATLAALRVRTKLFMRLADRRLYLYRSSDPDHTKEPLRAIELKRATVAAGRKDCEFFVAVPGKPKPYSFKVESTRERDDWIDKIVVVSKVNITSHYNLGRRLGRGAFGEVRLAEDRETAEKFAIKVLRKNGRSARQKTLLEREVKALTSVNHENIVRTFDVFDQSGELCIVSEYVDGGELGHLMDGLNEKNTAAEDVVQNLAMQLLKGLLHLHQNGIVHRDIKPENILCVGGTWPPKVKLTDFGLSNFIDEDESVVLKSVVGSPVFIAPEMVMRKGYTTAVDLWGVGVVVYQLLVGTTPFNVNDFEDYKDFLQHGPKFREPQWSSLSSEAQSFVRSLLQVDPAKRLTAASALQHQWLAKAETCVPKFDKNSRISRRLMMSRRISGLISNARKSTVIELPSDGRAGSPSPRVEVHNRAMPPEPCAEKPVSSERARAELRKAVLGVISMRRLQEAGAEGAARVAATHSADMKNLTIWIDRLAGKNKAKANQ